MKLAALFLAALAAAAPSDHGVNRAKLIVTDESYPEDRVVYTGEHDIVDIAVPCNGMNYKNEVNTENEQYPIFFVEADLKNNVVKEYKGVFVRKSDNVKKVLDNGQCAIYTNNYTVYFGAKDGIYKYNHVDQTATKFGTVIESVIRMAINSERNEVYYLTEDYVLYKYNEGEVKTSKVEAVKDARDIIFDASSTLFYYDGTKQFYSYNGAKVTKIEGLPANPTNIVFVRVPIAINKTSVIIDGVPYILNAEGTSENTKSKFQILPNVYTADRNLGELFAINKKIYKCHAFRPLSYKTKETQIIKCL